MTNKPVLAAYSQISLQSVKTNEKGLTVKCFCEFSNADTEEYRDAVYTVECHNSPHPDLRDRLDAFKLHLLFLCGYIDTEDYTDGNIFNQERNRDLDSVIQREYDQMGVTGIKISGEFKDKITIEGVRINLMSEFIILKTPVMLIKTANYCFSGQLEEHLSDLTAEVINYLNGKEAPYDKQLDMFADMKPEIDDHEVLPNSEDVTITVNGGKAIKLSNLNEAWRKKKDAEMGEL